MNRKQKIIVSVIGIFVVLLILVGLTYAYFLTRINGNTNIKSISVGTKYLEVTYIDGNNEIATATSISPSSNAIITKEFSVRNDGDTTNYAVIIENISIKDKDNNDTTFTYSDDLTYTLTCTNSDTTSCGEQSGTFPTSDRGIYYVTIDSGITQSYELKIYYNESGIDQSADMGKTFSAKINISEPATINPYKTEQNTLKYHILNNSILNLNGTSLVSTPQTQPAHPIYTIYKSKGEEQETSQTHYYNSSKSGWWIYGTDYEVNETTGTFTLKNKGVCQYSDSNCITKLVNINHEKIYVTHIGPYTGYRTESEANAASVTDTQQVFRITNIETGTNDTISYKEIYNIPDSIEREMSYTEDEKGTSYYFRGDVKDNYVNFAGKCWRIVRIDGDGNTRLILEDKNTTCNNASYTGDWVIGTGTYGHDNSDGENFYADYDGCTSDSETCQKNIMNTWYTSNLASKQSYLNSEKINIGDTIIHYDYDGNIVDDNYFEESGYYLYDNYNRISTLEESSLLQNVENANSFYIFPISIDELAHLGFSVWDNYNNNFISNSNYMNSFWTISLSDYTAIYADAFCINYYRNIVFPNPLEVYQFMDIRPMISLKSSTVYNGGDGTKSNPYQID